MPSVIDRVSQVSLTTATVNLAVIRVGDKQMTQSVFNQIPVEPFFSLTRLDNGDWKPQRYGNLWGIVHHDAKNCHPADTRKYLGIPDHHHILWQKGDDLRKSCLIHERTWGGGFLYTVDVKGDRDVEDEIVATYLRRVYQSVRQIYIAA